MWQSVRMVAWFLVVCGLALVVGSQQASAQAPVAVSTFYPAIPTISYYPERRGLFGRRIVYRPYVTYAPAAPVTTYYVPAPTVVQTPVTTYYAPAPTIIQSPVTAYMAPPTITTYYPPLIIY